MNILLTNVGRRTYMVKYLIEETKKIKNLKIHLAENDEYSAALNYNHKPKKHYTPLVKNNEKKYMKKIFDIVKRNRIKLIIPCSDFELKIFSENKKKLNNLFCKVLISSKENIKNFYDKRLTFKICKKNNLLTPEIFNSQKELNSAKKKNIIQKDIYGSGSSGLKYFKENETIQFTNKKLFQKRINGKELHLDILNDFDGNFVSSCTKKKILMRAGETDQAQILNKNKYDIFSKKISSVFRHVGNLDCDVIEDNSGRLFLIDLNPRFGGGYPFTHESGLNYIRIILNMALGKKINIKLKPKLKKFSKGISIHSKN